MRLHDLPSAQGGQVVPGTELGNGLFVERRRDERVQIGPGATILTRIPFLATFCTRLRVNPTIAPFVAV